MIEQILQYADPVNAALLLAMWWRLEKQGDRVNRLEKKLLDRGTSR